MDENVIQFEGSRKFRGNYEKAITELHLALGDAIEAALDDGFDPDDVRDEVEAYFESEELTDDDE